MKKKKKELYCLTILDAGSPSSQGLTLERVSHGRQRMDVEWKGDIWNRKLEGWCCLVNVTQT